VGHRGGGHRREQGRRQGGAQAQDGDEGHSQFGNGAQQGEGDDGGGAEYPAHQHHKAQEGEPVRSAVEQEEPPDRRGHERGGEADPTYPRGAALPQPHGADPHEAGQRRRQGDGVVGVDDALAQADDQPGADERPAEEQQGGALAVRPLGPDGEDEQHGTHEEGARQQPRHHVPEAVVEEPQEPGGPPLTR